MFSRFMALRFYLAFLSPILHSLLFLVKLSSSRSFGTSPDPAPSPAPVCSQTINFVAHFVPHYKGT